MYHNPYGMFGTSVSGRVEHVPLDPSKAMRATLTLAKVDGHECRYNRLTRELFDRHDGELSYVGRGTGDTERDVAVWMRWMGVMP